MTILAKNSQKMSMLRCKIKIPFVFWFTKEILILQRKVLFFDQFETIFARKFIFREID